MFLPRMLIVVAGAACFGCEPGPVALEIPPNLRCADLVAVSTTGAELDGCSIAHGAWVGSGHVDDDIVRRAVISSAAHDIPCDEDQVSIKLLPRRRDSTDFRGQTVPTYFNGSRDIVLEGCGQRVTYVESCDQDRARDALGIRHYRCEYVVSARMPLVTKP